MEKERMTTLMDTSGVTDSVKIEINDLETENNSSFWNTTTYQPSSPPQSEFGNGRTTIRRLKSITPRDQLEILKIHGLHPGKMDIDEVVHLIEGNNSYKKKKFEDQNEIYKTPTKVRKKVWCMRKRNISIRDKSESDHCSLKSSHPNSPDSSYSTDGQNFSPSSRPPRIPFTESAAVCKLIKNLCNAHLLHCRAVFPAWKDIIDDYLKEEDNVRLRNEFTDWTLRKPPSTFDSGFPLDRFTFMNHSSLKKFMNLLSTDEDLSNPFINQSLTIHDSQELDDSQIMWRFLTETQLPKYGAHLRHCKLQFYAVHHTFLTVFTRLLETITNTPNLISLIVIYDGFGNSDDEKGSGMKSLKENWNKDLQLLPKLKYLKAIHCHNLHPDILQQLLANPVEKLKITSKLGVPQKFENLQLTTLRELYVGEESILQFNICSPNLQVLVYHNWITLDELAEASQNLQLSYTLEKLTVNLDPPRNPFSILLVNFPQLTCLRVTMRSFLPSSFLTSFKTLQQLYLCVKSSENSSYCNDLFLNLKKIQNTNIWTKLPRLQTWEVKVIQIHGRPGEKTKFKVFSRPSKYEILDEHDMKGQT